MSTRISNDENIENLRKRKIYRMIIIIFSILTILLALGSIFISQDLIYPALLVYLVVAYFSNKRKKTIINKREEIYQVEKEIENVKKRKK